MGSSKKSEIGDGLGFVYVYNMHPSYTYSHMYTAQDRRARKGSRYALRYSFLIGKPRNVSQYIFLLKMGEIKVVAGEVGTSCGGDRMALRLA